MTNSAEDDTTQASVHESLLGDPNAQKRIDNEWAVLRATFRSPDNVRAPASPDDDPGRTR